MPALQRDRPTYLPDLQWDGAEESGGRAMNLDAATPGFRVAPADRKLFPGQWTIERWYGVWYPWDGPYRTLKECAKRLRRYAKRTALES